MRHVLALVLLVAACGRSKPTPPQVVVDRWTFEDVEAAARRLDAEFSARGQVLTRDAFLPHIQPVYRSRYTILHDSDASEGIDSQDHKDGRVLAFGEDGTMILAWTRDGNEVQIAQHRKSHLELRRIAFAKRPGEKLEVSAANPIECGGAVCHGDPKDPHYRWDPYPHWPKAYAGREDYVDPGAEATRLRGLFTGGHPAFAALLTPPQFDKSLQTFRVGVPKQVRATSAQTLDRQAGASYQYRPNTFLTLALGANHAEQLFHHLKAGARYQQLRVPLLFVMNRCLLSDPGENARINQQLAALHKRDSRPGPPPQIDVGRDARRWMPWFTLLGTDPERWLLTGSDDATPQLFNVGFTSLAFVVAAFVFEDLVAEQPAWATHYARGTLRAIEDGFLDYIEYSDRDAHTRQTQILDQRARFLNVEPRPSLRALQDRSQWKSACKALGEETRRLDRFRLEASVAGADSDAERKAR